MTTLREAAEMALMALEHPNFQGAEEVEIILRSVLEQHAQQEKTYASLERYTQEIRTILAGSAKRKPLTDEQLVEAYCCVNDKEWAIGGMTDARIFARAIERAHGIGSKA